MPEFTAVWALEQKAGRGRRSRKWDSPLGNLYVSMLLRPDSPLSQVAQLSLVAALALGDAIGEYVESSRVRNKWPNDVQIDGCKVAGLLLESFGDKHGNADWVVVGCGVNVAVHPNFPNYDTTSLNRAAKVKIDIKEFLDTFLNHFEARYNVWYELGVDPIRKDWIARAANIGQEIVVRLAQTEIKGVFEGLDRTGAFILARENGVRELVTAGEIFAEQ